MKRALLFLAKAFRFLGWVAFYALLSGAGLAVGVGGMYALAWFVAAVGI